MFEGNFKNPPEMERHFKNNKNYQVQILTFMAATTGRFSEWVDVFLEKRSIDVSSDNISMVVAPKWTTTCNNDDFQADGQDESKFNRTIFANSGVHTLQMTI